LPLGDRPVIVHSLSSIISAGISELVVVLGARHEEIARVLRGFPVSIVYNRQPDSDMAASVRAGLAALSPAATAALVCLADHPLVSADTHRLLLMHHGQEPEKILISSYQGKRGHPTLFPLQTLKELDRVSTMRELVTSHSDRVRLLETTDRGVLLDMDTPEDYRKIVGIFRELCQEDTEAKET